MGDINNIVLIDTSIVISSLSQKESAEINVGLF